MPKSVPDVSEEVSVCSRSPEDNVTRVLSIVMQNRPSILLMLMGRFRVSRDRAEDVLQEACLRLLQGNRGCCDQGCNLEALLRWASRNVMIDSLRKASSRYEVPVPQTPAGRPVEFPAPTQTRPDAALIEEEERRRLCAFFVELAAGQEAAEAELVAALARCAVGKRSANRVRTLEEVRRGDPRHFAVVTCFMNRETTYEGLLDRTRLKRLVCNELKVSDTVFDTRLCRLRGRWRRVAREKLLKSA